MMNGEMKNLPRQRKRKKKRKKKKTERKKDEEERKIEDPREEEDIFFDAQSDATPISSTPSPTTRIFWNKHLRQRVPAGLLAEASFQEFLRQQPQ